MTLFFKVNETLDLPGSAPPIELEEKDCYRKQRNDLTRINFHTISRPKNSDFYFQPRNNETIRETKLAPKTPPAQCHHFLHDDRVNQAFFPLRILLLLMGRFPFIPSKSKDCSAGTERGHGNNYTTSLKSPCWIYFGLTSGMMLMMFLLTTKDFLDVFLGWGFLSIGEWSVVDQALFQANLVPFVLVWSCLLHTAVGNISFFLNRRNVVKMLNYWNFAAQQLNIELPKSVKKFLILSNLWFLGLLAFTLATYRIRSIHITRQGSKLFGIMAFRTFYISADSSDNYSQQTFGLFTMLYAMYASRAFLFVYVFKCRMLKHCFKEWNSRLENVMASTSDNNVPMNTWTTICTELYHQHIILLRLMKLTDKAFSAVLLSYYGSQILNMCFELYYVAMSGNLDTKSYCKNYGTDTFVAILLLLQNIYVFLSVSLQAAYVGEEANKGFDIVKSRGVRLEDNKRIRNLLLSLAFSFQQKIVLTGGHYFGIDKPFIITVMGAVFTYFIIILQYGHQLLPMQSYGSNNACQTNLFQKIQG